MKNSIKRAQSRAGSSFAERENFRPKVKQLKKTLLTLVALLAVTTGAWADGELLTTITASSDFTDGNKTFDNIVTVSFNGEVSYNSYNKGWGAKADSQSEVTITVTAAGGANITSVKFFSDNSSATDESKPFEAVVSTSMAYDAYVNGNRIGSFITKIEVYGTAPSAAASTVEVAWDEDKKTGTFSMPGGNVTLEPDYYPQATVADGGVTAADADARATTDDPLVKVDATKLTGAKKLMYFVSNSGTAPAYDAEGWTDQLPTAEGFTQAGIVYVWYYPVGTDEGVDGATATYSDGDMNATALAVNIAAAPTYAVTFAEGTPETDKWKAEPNTGVKKGETVTVTYTGAKKVIGVKAEKKASTPALLTLSVCGETIYYAEGETWAEAIQNHPTENHGWEIYEGDVDHEKLGFLLQNDDFVPGTAKIDPNASYDSTGI